MKKKLFTAVLFLFCLSFSIFADGWLNIKDGKIIVNNPGKAIEDRIWILNDTYTPIDIVIEGKKSAGASESIYIWSGSFGAKEKAFLQSDWNGYLDELVTIIFSSTNGKFVHCSANLEHDDIHLTITEFDEGTEDIENDDSLENEVTENVQDENTYNEADESYFTGDGCDNLKVVIAPIEIIDGSSEENYLSRALKTGLTDDFVKCSNINLLDGENKNLLQMIDKMSSAEYDENDSLQLGRLVQARYVLSPTIEKITRKGSTKYNVSAKVNEIETGKIIASSNFTNLTEDELFVIHGLVSKDLLPKLGVKLTETGKKYLESVSVVSEE